MNEHEIEPVRGLPGNLPPGERILWQGSPQPTALALGAFHVRSVAIYFGLLVSLAIVLAVSNGSGFTGTLITTGLGCVAIAVLYVLGWISARASVYTLTNRRIVMRIGVALPTCVNLPLSRVAAVDLSAGGDIALRLTDAPPLGWFTLWPHARPWRLARPEPTLRAVAEAQTVAAQIARACLAVQPNGQMATVQSFAQKPVSAQPHAVAA